jgi:hypothetical protein
MAERGITAVATSVAPEERRGWIGRLAGWLRGLAEAEEASLRHARGERGGNCARAHDAREDDQCFAAFMTGPLY